MLTRLRIQGFKSWSDTGDIKLGKLTGFFGPNSSGKTSLLQFLLMLKQTVESSDRSRVLHTGDANSYVDLGTFYDIIHKHQVPGELKFDFGWIAGLNKRGDRDKVEFSATITGERKQVTLSSLFFDFNLDAIGLKRENHKQLVYSRGEELGGFELDNEPWFRHFENDWAEDQTDPINTFKFYGLSRGFFPISRSADAEFVYELESLFNNTYYLGPLREYPGRLYSWAGERPADVGRRGERTVEALLAADVQHDGKLKDPDTGKAHTVTQHVAYWLKRLGLIHSFKLKPIAKNRKEYEVKVKQSPGATEVALTDVGFGISQVLPVLTLCFYAPAGSTIIFEQPEIHLHPAVQAGLADVFLDAIKQRGIQIILESHSEHLLHRLQLRIAEEEVSTEDIRLYFAQANDGESKLTELDLDEYGNIRNWPKGFFGDEIGDLMKMTQAEVKRKMAARQG